MLEESYHLQYLNIKVSVSVYGMWSATVIDMRLTDPATHVYGNLVGLTSGGSASL